MWVDVNCNLADVQGQAQSWGITTQPTAGGAENNSLTDLDGVTIAGGAATTLQLYLAAPLVCSWLTSCDKLIPTGLMAPIRVQLTVDTLSSILTDTTTVNGLTISQPELCFQTLDLGAGVQNMIASVSPKLYLKSQGWANASQSVGITAANSFNTLVYNHRYKSIENLYFLSSSSSTAKCINTWGDSLNPLGATPANGTNVNGTFQVQIGQSVYPQLPINNATGGYASIFQYLRETVGIISDQRNTMSLISTSFTGVNNDASQAGATTANFPAKFIIGIPLSRVNQVSPYQQVALMSGVSAQSTPINVLLNTGSGFVAAMNFFLIAQYTQLVEIDVMSRQVQVIC
jgi:hypothetical protein